MRKHTHTHTHTQTRTHKTHTKPAQTRTSPRKPAQTRTNPHKPTLHRTPKFDDSFTLFSCSSVSSRRNARNAEKCETVVKFWSPTIEKCDRAIRRHAADTEQFETFDKMVAESLGSIGNPSVTIRNIIQKWSLGRSVARSPIGPNVGLSIHLSIRLSVSQFGSHFYRWATERSSDSTTTFIECYESSPMGYRANRAIETPLLSNVSNCSAPANSHYFLDALKTGSKFFGSTPPGSAIWGRVYRRLPAFPGNILKARGSNPTFPRMSPG